MDIATEFVSAIIDAFEANSALRIVQSRRCLTIGCKLRWTPTRIRLPPS
jgi:hypothetical protein